MAKKRSKRSNGEGSIFEKPNGKYQAQASYYINGKRHKKTKTANNYSDAVAHLKKIHEGLENGIACNSSLAVERFLLSWIEDVKRQHSASTYCSYRNILKNHVIPIVGKKKLDKLSPMDVQAMVNQLRDTGVGSRSVQMSYNYLNRGMRRAYKFRMIRENPCSAVDKPKHTSAEANPFTVEEVKKLLSHLKGHHFYWICYTALTTGMRPGELFGLFWENVNLDENKIHVVQQLSYTEGVKELKPPKTKASIRTIDISDNTVNALIEQRKMLLRLGFASNEYVFCGKKGISIGRANFSSAWKVILQRAGISHRGFHHMRHTFATFAISSGVPITVVSATLGHASTSMTLDIYAHVMPSMKSDATNAVSKLIG